MIENPSQRQYNSYTLWLSIIALQHTTFTTTGRGTRPGTPFTYTISRSPGHGGRHYAGECVDGYGNELWIIVDGVKRERSISRSTIDHAYSIAVEKGGRVKGPKALGVPGAGSYVYPVFVRLGIIHSASDPSALPVPSHAHTAGESEQQATTQQATTLVG